jgi:general secretion pathway protein C
MSMGLFSRSQGLFSSLPKGAKGRPPFEGAYLYILALFTGFLLADLGILYVRPGLLPTEPPPMRPQRMLRQNYTTEAQYAKITDRNIFNADKKIPPALTADGSGEGDMIDMAPVASQLPLKLEGTLVHANPKKSVASIASKSNNTVNAYMVDTEIEGMARITAIERRKVIFRNLNNQRLEYIDIPKDSALTFGMKEPSTGEEVKKEGDTVFTMRRQDISKYTADLGSILQQARMVPNIVPGTGGRVEGFRFVAIQPGSIYEKLGFKPMDVIKKVNNEDVNSPTKAMELYNALKTEGRISLVIERNGRDETFQYNISD